MSIRLPFAALAALSLTFSVPDAAQLSRAEHAMVRTVDAEQERTVALLERWVNQNSGTLSFAGVEAVAQMVRPEFEALGFTVDWFYTPKRARSSDGAASPAAAPLLPLSEPCR